MVRSMNVKKTKKFKENRPENYHVHDNNQPASGLSSRAPDFIPVGNLTDPGAPGVPAPVDSIGRSGVALMQGGQMCAMFILPV